MNIIKWLFCAFTLFGVTYGAKILVVVPTPTKSHHYILEKLALELVAREHQVTLITAYPQEKPLKNLEEIIIPNYYDELMKSFMGENEDAKFDITKMQPSAIASLYALPTMGLRMTSLFLETPIIKTFIQSSRKYDAVIGEAFFIEGILAGFVKKFNAPLIAVAPGPTSFFSNYMVGNPSPSSYIPSVVTGYNERMSFKERVNNFIIETLATIYFQTIYLPQQDTVMRQYFGNGLPDIRTIMENTSLVLVNHHHSLAFPRPYVPSMIEIGGFHVKPPKPLPKEIQRYMDDAKHGVIILSMGSHFKSSLMPKETVQAILKAFSRLKENVIWKFDDPNLPGVPKNVKIMKWVPQSDILAHPKLKLLITHGGMLSTTEAVLRGVPMIGLPVFGDQPSNMKQIERLGYGKALPILGLTENLLYDTIMEIKENAKYRNNVKRGSILLQDTPLPATETAMYWIEYVIRHKGAPHLRSASLDLKWYQLYLLDVLCVFVAVLAVTLWISYKTVSCVCKKLCGRKPVQVSNSKKKN